MTRKRKQQICLDDTPFYHCMSRCVRRAYLFGDDDRGRNYDHRKGWIVSKFKQLASIFAIDVCAYAVMSNHFHLVLFVDEAKAKNWSDREVAERWRQLFRGHILVERWLHGALSEVEEVTALELVADWRKRLCDISWFMRCLNEAIARQANKEDNCNGRFWEGRFKSQALLDEQALLSCMVYVDLNPVRAGIADSPETCDFTSIQERIQLLSKTRRLTSSLKRKTGPRTNNTLGRYIIEDKKIGEASLKELVGNTSDDGFTKIPFTLNDYLQLVDWTGRAVRLEKGKRGSIAKNLPPILQRLNIESKDWLRETQYFESRFKHFAGALYTLETKAIQLQQAWLHGMGGVKERQKQIRSRQFV